MPLNTSLGAMQLNPGLLNTMSVVAPGHPDSAQNLYREDAEEKRGLFTTVGYAAAGTVASTADTFLESFGVLDENQMEEYFQQNTPDFGQFFTDNRQGLQIAGDIAGLFIPGMIGAKAVRTTGFLGKMATKTFGKKVTPFLSTGKRAQDLFRPSIDEARRLAATKHTYTISRADHLRHINSKLLRRKVADSIIENVAGDLLIAATMHESEFLFPEEFSLMDNLLMFGIPNAVIGGLSHVHGRFVLFSGINKAITEAAPANRDKVMNVVTKGSPLNRGISAAIVAREKKKLRQNLTPEDVNSPAVQENLRAADTAYTKSLTNIFKESAQDSLEGVAPKHELAPQELRTMAAYAEAQPEDLAPLVTLNPFTPGADRIMKGKLDSKVRGLKVQRAQQVKKLENAQTAAAKKKIALEIAELDTEINQLNKYTVVTFDPDGWVTAGSIRTPMFQDIASPIQRQPNATLVNTHGSVMELDGLNIVVPARKDFSYEERVKGHAAELELDPAIIGIDDALLPAKSKGVSDKLKAFLEAGEDHARFTTLDPDFLPVKTGKLRSRLPETPFIVYGKKGASDGLAQYRLRKDKTYRQPVELTRDDVFGAKTRHLLIAAPQKRTLMNSHRFMALSHFDKTRVYGMHQHQIDGIRIADDIRLPEDYRHHTQMDAVLEMVEKHGTEDRPIIGATGRDKLEMRSINQKFMDFQRLSHQADEAYAAGNFTHEYKSAINLARALNLPLGEFGKNPTLDFFNAHRIKDRVVSLHEIMPEIRTTADLKTAILKNMDDSSGLVPDDILLRGNMLKVPQDRRPVVGVINDADEIPRTRKEQLVLHGTVRAKTLDNLNNAQQPLVRAIMETLRNNGEAVQALKQGFAAATDGFPLSGAFGRLFGQQAHLVRELPGSPQSEILSDLAKRLTEQHSEQILKEASEYIPKGGTKPLTNREVFSAMRRNRAASVMYNTYIASKGAGWDLVPEAEIVKKAGKQTGIPEDLYSWRLADTTHNRNIWRQMFDEDMPIEALDDAGKAIRKPPLMPITGKKGSVLEVPHLTYAAAKSMTRFSHELLDSINTILQAQGLKTINKKPWHTPPKNLAAAHRVLLVDAAGQTRYVATGATESQASQAAAKEIELAKKRGETLARVTESTIRARKESFAEEFFLPENFIDPRLQTGKAQGRSFGTTIEQGPQLAANQLESVFAQYQNVWREVFKVVFEEELNHLAFKQTAAGLAEKDESVYTALQRSLLGLSRGHLDHPVSNVYRTVADGYDRGMAALYNRRFAKKPWRKIEKEYKALNEAFGDKFKPYSSLAEYAETREQIKIPPVLQRHTAAMNEISVAAAIRWFDAGMAAINMLSLPTIIPPTVKMISRRSWLGETNEQHLARVNAVGGSTEDGIGYVSATKATAQGIWDIFSAEKKHIRDLARERGYFSQSAAEVIEVFGRAGEGMVTGLLRDVGNVVSVLTDKTEELSRAVSFMTMHRIGKDVYNLHDEAAMTFAHHWANKVIGDFRPSNRPVVFQGAVGMPLGLFTTFMWNYLHRIGQAFETKTLGANFTQFGLQGAIFGAESIPGLQSYMQLYTSNSNGDENIIDRMNQAYGTEFTDVFLNGTISTLLPRSLGAGGGISIGPRAAVGIPFEQAITKGQLDPADSIAGFRLAAKMFQYSKKVFDNVVQEEGLNPIHAAQLFAATNINKGISNFIELATNRSTTINNDLIERETRTQIGIASRLLGFKPLFTDELKQEIYRANMASRRQANLKQRLAESMQTAFRTGNMDVEFVDDALHDYILAGGSPENFRQYFHSQYVKAQYSRVHKELAEALRGNYEQNRAVRLLELQSEGY